MNRTILCLVLFAVFAFDLDCALPQTADGGGVSAKGAAFSVTTNVAPAQVIWGNVVNITGTAAGGTPAYQYAIGTANDQMDVKIYSRVATNRQGRGELVHKCRRPGRYKAKVFVSDATGNGASDQKTFTVLAPNKIKCKTLVVKVQVSVSATTVTAFANVIFEIKRGNTNVGSWAVGLAQEKVAKPSTTDPNKPGTWSRWAPASADPRFIFQAPFINDFKGFAVAKIAWDGVANNTVVPGSIRFQKIRVVYKNSNAENIDIESKTFKLYFKKINATTLAIVHEKQ